MKKKKNQYPVIGIKISPLARLEDGVPVPITPDQYQHNPDYIPSRNVAATYGTERVNIGQCIDVPKRV